MDRYGVFLFHATPDLKNIKVNARRKAGVAEEEISEPSPGYLIFVVFMQCIYYAIYHLV